MREEKAVKIGGGKVIKVGEFNLRDTIGYNGSTTLSITYDIAKLFNDFGSLEKEQFFPIITGGGFGVSSGQSCGASGSYTPTDIIINAETKKLTINIAKGFCNYSNGTISANGYVLFYPDKIETM